MTAAGREVPLMPGGEDIPITWANRHDYVRMGTPVLPHRPQRARTRAHPVLVFCVCGTSGQLPPARV